MSRTILLADDSVTIQKVVELTFLDEGYKVVAVGNGSEAAARLDEVAPDLVIADVHMPGLNGYDLARRAKQWRAGMPVLLLVGTFEPFDKGQFSDSGADAVLKKPFDSQELLRQAQDLLRTAPAAAPEAPAVFEPAPEWSLADLATDEPLAAATAVPMAPVAAPAPAAAAEPIGPAAAAQAISDADVERIARRVAELISERVVREVSWEVIPDLAEVIIKDRIRELESQVD